MKTYIATITLKIKADSKVVVQYKADDAIRYGLYDLEGCQLKKIKLENITVTEKAKKEVAK